MDQDHRHDYGSSGECSCGMHREGATATARSLEDIRRDEQLRALDELTQLSQEMGLCDLFFDPDAAFTTK